MKSFNICLSHVGNKVTSSNVRVTYIKILYCVCNILFYTPALLFKTGPYIFDRP